tara:strand:+ start:383 stop:1759 length:1377 start_codon:yes stop_codon:yes gene_type:complete
LLELNGDEHCMSCKNKWDKKYLKELFPKKFLTKDMVTVKKKFLFDNERSRFPDTMPFVINYLKIPDMEKEIINTNKSSKVFIDKYYGFRKISNELWKKYKEINFLKDCESDPIKKEMYQKQINDIVNKRRKSDSLGSEAVQQHWKENRKSWKIKRNINRFKKALPGLNEEDVQERVKRKFVQKCQKEGCRGFLSSQWKCGICEEWTCKDCLEVIGPDKNVEHVCKKENVESAKLIKKETRSCPKCATPIFKINGCDQMFCTQCKTPFSWNTGRIVTGVIHNPHFFQWQRENGGTGPVNPHAHCGGLPTYWGFYRNLRQKVQKYPEINVRKYCIVMEHFTHFQEVVLIPLRNKLQREPDNKVLRMQYLAGEKTEKNFKTTLIKRYNRRNKEKEVLDIWTLLATVMIENINAMMDGTVFELEERYQNCQRLRLYVNKELFSVSETYSQKVKTFDDKFRLK